MDILCHELQEVAERVFQNLPKLHNTIVNISPGTSKSSLCSILFPAWIWTRMPQARIITASHTSDLVMDLSNKSRHVIKSDDYRRLFPDIEISETNDSKHYFSNTKGGDRFTCTVGGRSPIGMHAHFQICLPWECTLETSRGPYPIGKIVEKKLPLQILGLDNQTHTFAWQQIEAYETSTGRPLHKLLLADGTYLELTEDHPVFVIGKGYMSAVQVLGGDCVFFGKQENGIFSLSIKVILSSQPSERDSDTVYNLRTKPHHNYFANGILVHNCDDPLDPKKAASEAEIKNAQEFFDAVLPGRMVDKSITVLFLVMQRLHDEDPTGYLLAKSKREGSSKIRHICLPAEITDERTRASVSPPELVEFYDKEGLMDPLRLPHTVLNEKKADGIYAFSSQYLQCLVGTSLITTGRGLVPIKKVHTNDVVLTRQEWKKVLWSGKTGQTNKLSSVLFSRGSIVIGTGNHPVWCVDKGWVALDDLCGDDKVLSYREYPRTEEAQRETPLLSAIVTRTPTQLLINLKILNVCLVRNVLKSINDFLLKSIHELIFSKKTPAADLVTKNIFTTLQQKIAKDLFLNAQATSIQTSIAYPSAKNKQGASVYDLTVADAHEFVANGILVHNSPTPPEGGMFKAHWFLGRCQAAPYQCKRVVYVDRAFTANKNSCNTAITLLGEHEGNYYIGPVWVGRWEPDERDRTILMVAHQCRDRFGPRHEPTIVIEQEPSAGVDSYRHLAKKLNGFKVQADPARSNKELRADPFASQCAAGNVFLVEDNHWDIKGWMDELTHFPFAKYKDRVDSACLIAGTFVETKDGSKPIETITTDDFVLTRQGYKKVLWSGQSGMVSLLLKIEFSNGSELIGTPEHLVWTLQRGFIRMDSLVETDTVLFYKDILWENYQESKTQDRSDSSTWIVSENWPLSVLEAVDLGGRGIKNRVPVYDLCVEDAHEFFANGILVHNSGAYNWLTKNTRKVNASQFFILKSRQHQQNKLRVAFCAADLLTTIVLEEPTLVIMVKPPDLPEISRSTKLGNYFRSRSARDKADLLPSKSSDLPEISRSAKLLENVSGRSAFNVSDPPYLASAHLLAHTLVSFADLDPANLQQIWNQPLPPWNCLPADLVMSKQHTKQIWACITRQRTSQPTTILICGEGAIPQSLALGISDALHLERKESVEEIGSNKGFSRDDNAPNKHVYQQIKDGRFLVV